MNEESVRRLLQQLGIDLPPERAAAIAAEAAAIGGKLAATPRPAFEDEPTTFQVQSRKAPRP